MLGGVKLHTETLATGFYDDKINFKGGDFLKQKITLQLFREEQHLPSSVMTILDVGSRGLFGCLR
jgi:hypothetical protein